jgi:hypothetical protein
MVNNLPPPTLLPCPADRQKIIEEAKLVLTEARVIVEQLDRSFALLSAEQLGQCANAAGSAFMAAGAAVAFRAD